jgi:hypothetical protein
MHGVPRSVYVDRDSIYRSDRPATLEEELAGEVPLTQFGRAMKELDVILIKAHSPQAKGRVERKNRTMQDRLVKEMRLAGVSTMAAGNVFLRDNFLPKMNARQVVPAKEKTDAHRRLAKGVKLTEVLCFEEERTVGQDWCVRYENRWFQIDRVHEAMQLAGKHVIVRELLDGTIQVLHGQMRLVYRELSEQPKAAKVKKAIVNNKTTKPTAAQRPPAFGKHGRP